MWKSVERIAWRISNSAEQLAKGKNRTGTLLMTTSIAVVRFINNPCHRHIGLRPLEDFVNDTEKSLIQALMTQVDIVRHTLLVISFTN